MYNDAILASYPAANIMSFNGTTMGYPTLNPATHADNNGGAREENLRRNPNTQAQGVQQIAPSKILADKVHDSS